MVNDEDMRVGYEVYGAPRQELPIHL